MPNINSDRLWKHLRQLAGIGKNQDGSITRFPFTPQDRQAELLILSFMEEAGLDAGRDAAGNLIGRWIPEGLPAISTTEASPDALSSPVLITTRSLREAPSTDAWGFWEPSRRFRRCGKTALRPPVPSM